MEWSLPLASAESHSEHWPAELLSSLSGLPANTQLSFEIIDNRNGNSFTLAWSPGIANRNGEFVFDTVEAAQRRAEQIFGVG